MVPDIGDKFFYTESNTTGVVYDIVPPRVLNLPDGNIVNEGFHIWMRFEDIKGKRRIFGFDEYCFDQNLRNGKLR